MNTKLSLLMGITIIRNLLAMELRKMELLGLRDTPEYEAKEAEYFNFQLAASAMINGTAFSVALLAAMLAPYKGLNPGIGMIAGAPATRGPKTGTKAPTRIATKTDMDLNEWLDSITHDYLIEGTMITSRARKTPQTWNFPTQKEAEEKLLQLIAWRLYDNFQRGK